MRLEPYGSLRYNEYIIFVLVNAFQNKDAVFLSDIALHTPSQENDPLAALGERIARLALCRDIISKAEQLCETSTTVLQNEVKVLFSFNSRTFTKRF